MRRLVRMDARLFVLPTSPDLYGKPIIDSKRILSNERHTTLPTPDCRFPGWAAVNMEDGRFATDWRPHCCFNIPAGSQYGTKQWMQKNTDTIIGVSRQRLAASVGVQNGYDNTIEPPPAYIYTCDAEKCKYVATQLRDGIGVARQDAVPDLFGTYQTETEMRTQGLPAITQQFEGGRNTPRGRQFHALGNQPIM